MSEEGKPKEFHYTFQFSDGTEKYFHITLDYHTLGLLVDEKSVHPPWTRLGHHRCRHCPLSLEKHTHCPVAVHQADIIDAFGSGISHEKVRVTIETEARTYMAETTLQRALSSMFGIYMVTSGCPIMDKLRPMVDTHLPFATPEETTYRVITMYLLAQYFRKKHGQSADWDMKRLLELLEDISIVDVDYSARLRSIEIQDASLNAMTILHSFGQSTSFSIEENDMTRMERIFRAHYG